jgi:hypothetical protein
MYKARLGPLAVCPTFLAPLLGRDTLIGVSAKEQVMATQEYRVVGETISLGRRSYAFKHEGNGQSFSRSCPIEEAPFKIGASYTLAQIDALCPDIGVERAEIG